MTKLGQDTRIHSDGSDAQIMFTVDKITVDPTCGTNGRQTAGTHTVVLDVRVSTDTLAAGDSESLAKRISPAAFQSYDAKGSPHYSQPNTCTDHAPPTIYAPNSKYRTQIAFSVDTVPIQIFLPITGSTGTDPLVWKVSGTGQ
jgi:hypothetical protein